jgi:hypothetical protein
MADLIVQGQTQARLEPGDSQHVGIVLLATLQGIGHTDQRSLVASALLDGIVETAGDQFMPRSRHR